MFMAADQRICSCHGCAGCHDGKSDQVDPCQLFMQEHERKERTDERSNGVIGAGLGSSDDVLCTHIQENAQSV